MSARSNRSKVELIAGGLLVVGLGLMLYKTLVLGFPLWPGESRDVWTIESKIQFTPSGGPVEVQLKLPREVAGWSLLDEHFASSGFGFTLREEGDRRWAVWTRNELLSPATLYYKVQAYRLHEQDLPGGAPRPVEKPMLEDNQQAGMDILVNQLRSKSSDATRFTSLLIQALQPDSDDADARFLRSSWEEGDSQLLYAVLASAEIPAREIRGIRLQDGRRRQTLSSLVAIHDGSDWVLLDPESGDVGLPDDFFVWQQRGEDVLQVVGGTDSRLEFALLSNNMPARQVAVMDQQIEQYALLDFSVYALPVEQQGVFKGLLLLPVATMVVVIMRLLVGIKTSGTFMPVLIALAFMQTTLLPGLAMFLIIVSAGLWIRSLLSHLNLLLVSRISAVVIVVIFLMAALAIASYKLGFEQVLTVTFFPTIIMAWTIERMSILWEEEGAHDVLVQGGGSLLVAVLAYLAMANRVVAHLTFNFPEILLCLLGVILILGKYTGYRLSELYRFRALEKEGL